MDKGTVYYKQVQLLAQVLPLIASEKCFALKRLQMILDQF